MENAGEITKENRRENTRENQRTKENTRENCKGCGTRTRFGLILFSRLDRMCHNPAWEESGRSSNAFWAPFATRAPLVCTLHVPFNREFWKRGQVVPTSRASVLYSRRRRCRKPHDGGAVSTAVPNTARRWCRKPHDGGTENRTLFTFCEQTDKIMFCSQNVNKTYFCSQNVHKT